MKHGICWVGVTDVEGFSQRLFELIVDALSVERGVRELLEDCLWFTDKLVSGTSGFEREGYVAVRRALMHWIKSLSTPFDERGDLEFLGEKKEWEKAVEAFRRAGDQRGAYRALLVMTVRRGERYALAGDLNTACNVMAEAEEIAKKAGLSAKQLMLLRAKHLRLLALKKEVEGDFLGVGESYLEIAHIMEKLGLNWRADKVAALRFLSRHAMADGIWGNVARYQMEISELMREMGDVQGAMAAEARGLMAMAIDAEGKGQWVRAGECHKRAEEVLCKMGSRINALYARLNAYVCFSKGKGERPPWMDEAEELIRRAKREEDVRVLEREVKRLLREIEG